MKQIIKYFLFLGLTFTVISCRAQMVQTATDAKKYGDFTFGYI